MSYSLNSVKFLSNSQGSYQLVLEQACLVITSSTMTKTHMEGEALVWFQEGEDAGVFGTWEALVQAMLIQFGSTAYDDPMEALTRLRQTSTVALYKGEFEALANRI